MKPNNSRILLQVLILIATGANVFGQSAYVFDDVLKSYAKSEVKQLSEFSDRFNMKDTVYPADNNYAPSRYINILSLFNRENKAFYNDSSVIQFSNDIIQSAFLIGNIDSDWYATAHAEFTYRSSKNDVILTLQHVKNPTKGFCWIIVGVDIDALDVKFNRIESKNIGPVNNELSFLDLSKAFDSKKDLLSFTSKNYSPDYLSVFLYLVQSGTITFTQIREVTYHFLNAPQWIFTVEKYNRLSLNSGWLISMITRSTDDQKKTYKKNILHL